MSVGLAPSCSPVPLRGSQGQQCKGCVHVCLMQLSQRLSPRYGKDTASGIKGKGCCLCVLVGGLAWFIGIGRIKVVRTLYGKEGMRGFYSGLKANLIGVTPEKAIKLTVNDLARHWFAECHGIDLRTCTLPAWMGMASGAIAGFCQVLATNPMEMVKINMQMASMQSGPGTTTLSTWATVRQLGIRGLYRGSGATLMRWEDWAWDLLQLLLCRDIPFSVILFQSYAALSEAIPTSHAHHGFAATLLAGFGAGCIGAVLATPMDVAKTRFQVEWFASLQHGGTPRRLVQVYLDTWKQEGASAFFRGSLQRCFTVGPLFGISLATYHVQQKWINS